MLSCSPVSTREIGEMMPAGLGNCPLEAAEKSSSPLRSTKLIPRFVVWTRENLLAAGFILQNNSELRTRFRRLQNILVAVALRVQDKGFEFFVDLKDIGRNGNTIIVSLAFIFVDDDFHSSSDSIKVAENLT